MTVMDPSLKPNAEDSYERLRSVYRLALIEGIGPKILACLLEKFGDPASVFSANRAELRKVAGVGEKLVRRILEPPTDDEVDAELAICQASNIDVISQSCVEYPAALKQIFDPPCLLFRQGISSARDALAVAMVGSRHATHYGIRIAEKLAAGLARAGFTVVSGLARGIDAAAHRGALQGGGRTIAVLGGGHHRLYPPEHADLAKDVVGSGLIYSEHSPSMPPRAGSFPQRNRIISGLSQGVIVVEAPEASGSLITARLAMEQNRTVFAVPGPVDSRASRGCHRLLRDGAILVESVDDVLEGLGPLSVPAPIPAQGTVKSDKPALPPIQHPAELLLNPTEQSVLAQIDAGNCLIDSIIDACGLPAPQVLSVLSVLEMRRLIRRVGGQRVARP